MIELKPCPFCGGKPKSRSARAAEDVMDAWVQCTSCDALGPVIEGAYAEHEAAARSWNQRAGGKVLTKGWAVEEAVQQFEQYRRDDGKNLAVLVLTLGETENSVFVEVREADEESR